MNAAENTNQPQPFRRHVPACVQPGGIVETTLEKNRVGAMRTESTQQLHQRLHGYMLELRDPLRLPRFGHQDEDPLFRLCIDRQQGHDVREELLRNAHYRYLQQPDDYDLILGDLIPRDFRENARLAMAETAYEKGTNASLADDLGVFKRILQKGSQKNQSSLFTGLEQLDARIGGLRDLIFLGAEEGVGKTSLLLFIAWSILRIYKNVAVLFYSLDLPKTRIYERLVCCEAEMDFRIMQDPDKSAEQQRQIAEAVERIQRDVAPRLRVIECSFSMTRVGQGKSSQIVREGITADHVRQACIDLLRSSDTTQVVLMFDLFQKIDPRGDTAEGAATDHVRLDLFDQIRRESRYTDRPEGFPVIVTSEIRKDPKRRELCSNDLKGDGRMVSDADTVLLMWPESDNFATTSDVVPINLRIAKARDVRHTGRHQARLSSQMLSVCRCVFNPADWPGRTDSAARRWQRCHR